MFTYDIGVLFTVTVVIYATGWMFDHLLNSEVALRQWRYNSKGWAIALRHENWPKILNNSSLQFCNLFDAVYGWKWFSLKRVIRSLISSLFAVFVILIIIGPENSMLFSEIILDIPVDKEGRTEYDVPLYFRLISLFVLNFSLDYVSLLETRWVMGLCRLGGRPIWSLFLVDILLTVSLYILFWIILVYIALALGTFGVVEHDSFGKLDFLNFQYLTFLFIGPGMDLGTTGVFFLSTFFTSFFWILFFVFTVFLKCSLYFPNTMKTTLELLSDFERPGSRAVQC